jgi:hypothetical protein
VHEEKYRNLYPGYNDGIAVGQIIGLPPVLVYAQPAIRKR